MLSLTRVTMRRGPRPLLEEASFTMQPGWRVGLIGRNGSGKSSLFALLLGELSPDAGDVLVPRGLEIASVAQQTPDSEAPILDFVLDGDHALRAAEHALAAADAAGDGIAIAEAHARLDTLDAWAAPSRAATLLAGLGFPAASHARPVNSFSGGWRMRLNLARALLCRADLLLLDEPTNHLDLDAVLWLQQVLRQHPATLLVISHDRDFLDAVTTHTLHLDHCQLELYTGHYSAFEQQRAEKLRLQAARHATQQRRIAELQSYVDRFRAKATKARQAQSRLKMIERIEQVAPVHADSGFTFSFHAPDRLPSPMLRARGMRIGYGDTVVLDGVNLDIEPGDRLGLVGPNGAGKSTLVKLLADELGAMDGELHRDRHLNIGYFAQHQLEQLDIAATPYTHLVRLDPALGEQAARDYLGGFAFHGQRVFEPVRDFSGGERARLALALLVWRRPNLLLLDEPTNHLDLEMRHALEMALADFDGAMVLVTHDRHLMRATCDTLWRVADGGVMRFDGDLDAYGRWLLSRESTAAAGDGGSGAGADADVSSGDAVDVRGNARARRQEAAARRERERPLRAALKRLDTKLARVSAELVEVERALADPGLYAGDEGEGVQDLLREQGRLRQALESTEAEWLEAAEALEQYGSG